MLTEIVLALGYNNIDKRLPANETKHSQNRKETETKHSQQGKKKKKNRALTTIRLHIERIQDH